MQRDRISVVVAARTDRSVRADTALKQRADHPVLHVSRWADLERITSAPDLLILDHALWREASPRRLRSIPFRSAHTRTLVFVDTVTPAAIAEAVAHRIEGCIAMDASPELWLTTIGVVLRREIAMPRALLADALRLSMRRRSSDRTSRPASASHLDQSPRGALLTDREQEVVEFAVSGLSNRDISEQMGIGVATVKSHLHKAFAKLQIDRRSQLVGNAPMRLARAPVDRRDDPPDRSD